MTTDSLANQRVRIDEGTLKKNINSPPGTPRPGPPKSQVAPDQSRHQQPGSSGGRPPSPNKR